MVLTAAAGATIIVSIVRSPECQSKRKPPRGIKLFTFSAEAGFAHRYPSDMDRDTFRQRLHAASLRDELTGPSRPWRRIDVVDETGSTNADLLARAAAGEDIDGAVLIAESQTAGRGRNGRTWTTPPGSQIALSAGVGVGAVPTDAWGWLPLLTGVAVVDAVAEVAGVTAGLKWPNDVLVGTGKLAGILAEVAAPEPVVVVGLGLNVTEAPDPVATSLAMLGATVDRTVMADAVLRHLATRIDALAGR